MILSLVLSRSSSTV